MRVFIAALVLSSLVAQEVPVPGYEKFTKRELWEGAERWRAKEEIASADHKACIEKLASRTATVVTSLIVPPMPGPASIEHGPSTELVVLIALATFVVGGAIGFVLAKPTQPDTIVVH